MTVDQQVASAVLLVGLAVCVYIAGEIQREYRWQMMRWRRGKRETEPRKPSQIIEVLAFFA